MGFLMYGVVTIIGAIVFVVLFSFAVWPSFWLVRAALKWRGPARWAALSAVTAFNWYLIGLWAAWTGVFTKGYVTHNPVRFSIAYFLWGGLAAIGVFQWMALKEREPEQGSVHGMAILLSLVLYVIFVVNPALGLWIYPFLPAFPGVAWQ